MSSMNPCCKERDAAIAALRWIRDIARKNYVYDPKLRANGARTLARIIDKADQVLRKTGQPLHQ